MCHNVSGSWKQSLSFLATKIIQGTTCFDFLEGRTYRRLVGKQPLASSLCPKPGLSFRRTLLAETCRHKALGNVPPFLPEVKLSPEVTPTPASKIHFTEELSNKVKSYLP